MVIVKKIEKPKAKEDYIINAFKYVACKKECVDVHGFNVNPHNPLDAYNSMIFVKNFYGKTSDDPLVHIVVSFDKTVADDIIACTHAMNIAVYFREFFQVFWGVHKKEREDSFYHVHYVINTISYKNGQRFNANSDNMKQFCRYVSEITKSKTRLKFDKIK